MDNKVKILTTGAIFQLVSGCAQFIDPEDKSSEPCNSFETVQARFEENGEYGENKASAISKTALDVSCNATRQLILTPFRAGAFIECGLRKVAGTLTGSANDQKEKNNDQTSFCDIFEQSP